MSVIDDIKNIFGNYHLNQQAKLVHRNKTFLNIADVKTIGILFDAGSKEEFELVKKYVNYLRDMKKRVKAIGFFNQKTIPPLTYSKLEFDFFSQKELNWQNCPNSIYVKNFIADSYDLLLDLNIQDLFPLRYIATLSKARFKVGRTSERNTAIFDLMINIDQSKNLKFFLRNVDEYLFLINKKNENTNNLIHA